MAQSNRPAGSPWRGRFSGGTKKKRPDKNRARIKTRADKNRPTKKLRPKKNGRTKTGEKTMKRPGYREAIEWLAHNDDCYWLGDDDPCISVSSAMVRDLFDVPDEKLISDLRRALKKAHPNHEANR